MAEVLGGLLLVVLGIAALVWGGYMERKHVLWDAERDAEQADPKVDPKWVSNDEMHAMGWKPCNDGSGLWEVDWDRIEGRTA